MDKGTLIFVIGVMGFLLLFVVSRLIKEKKPNVLKVELGDDLHKLLGRAVDRLLPNEEEREPSIRELSELHFDREPPEQARFVEEVKQEEEEPQNNPRYVLREALNNGVHFFSGDKELQLPLEILQALKEQPLEMVVQDAMAVTIPKSV